MFSPSTFFSSSDSVLGIADSVLSGHGRYVDEVEVVFNTDILFNDKLFSFKRGTAKYF